MKSIYGQNIIVCDRGLEALYQLKIIPNHVVGDFDSVSSNVLTFYQNKPQVVFHTYNAEKDNTDTDIALKLAIKLKSSEITILGALGKRMDHAIANIHILKDALEAEIPCQIPLPSKIPGRHRPPLRKCSQHRPSWQFWRRSHIRCRD